MSDTTPDPRDFEQQLIDLQRQVEELMKSSLRPSVSVSAEQTVGSGGLVRVNWDGYSWLGAAPAYSADRYAMFDAATPSYVELPRDGWWTVSGWVAFAAAAASTLRQSVLVAENMPPLGGSGNIQGDVRASVAASGAWVPLSRKVYLGKGSRVAIDVRQDSGGNLDVSAYLGVVWDHA